MAIPRESSWMDYILPAIGAYKGYQDGKKDTNLGSTQRTLDPRIAEYLYGNGSGGLLGSAGKVFNDQMRTGGMNADMRRGLDMQRQVLQSPQFSQGFEAMRANGMGLMNAPMAGNPFTQGGQPPGMANANLGMSRNFLAGLRR